jgi:hypothetical protein
MSEGLQLFGSLALASHRNDSRIKLPRSQDEVVMLAFDQQNNRLVELHIFTGKPAAAPVSGQPTPSLRRWIKPGNWQSRRKLCAPQPYRRQTRSLRTRTGYLNWLHQLKTSTEQAEVRPERLDQGVQLTACTLLREVAKVRGHSFMTVLEVGIDDGLAYYVTTLNEGEFVQDYVSRRGAVPTVVSLALVHQLLQDLGRAGDQARLVSTMRLDRVLVSSHEEEFLELRVIDYGLSEPRSAPPGQNSSHLVGEACRLLFLLMTGHTYAGGNPDDFAAIAELPTGLRIVIKSVLTRPANISTSIKALRDEVREALCSNVNLVQARNPKMLLVADAATLPISHLQKLLLGDIPLKTLLGTSFQIENPRLVGCHPFAIPALSVSTDQPLTLHLLPPARIVNQSDFIALPPQAWRQDPARQPNLLHMLSLWKGPDWSFVSELREPGMTLSGLMAKRGMLNPGEVILLLRQIHAGLEQAVETGVQRLELDPASIQLCVGYDGPVLPRDLERLHQKRLDVWPKFMVKLRLHKTMLSLCKPRLIDLSPWEPSPSEERNAIAARDERHRSFIGLAAYLLTGKGQIRGISEFPTSMPEMAAAYVHENLQRVMSGAAVPSPVDFTEQLGHLLTATSIETNAEESPLALHEMESAGYVSDFEEYWAQVDSARADRLSPINESLKTLDFNHPLPFKASFPWLALAATMLVLAATTWMILGDLPMAKLAAVPSSQPQESVHLQEVAEPAPKPAAAHPSQTLPQPVIHKIPAVVVALTLVPDPPMAQASPMPATPKPQASAPTYLENVKPQENQLAEKMLPADPPKPQLMASAAPASGVAAQDTEPVIIRRAMSAAPQDEKIVQSDLSQKKWAENLPIPMPCSGRPKASGLIPLTFEEPPTSLPAPAPAVAVASLSIPPTGAAGMEAVTIRQAIILSSEEIKQALRAEFKSQKKRAFRR